MYFKTWPFRVVPERSPDVWADRKRLYEDMSRAFRDTVEKKRSTAMCIWGYVGAGKSHSLLHFRWLFENEKKNIVVYSPLPKQMRRFADLYQQGFFNAINLISLSRVAADIWAKLNPKAVDLTDEMKALETVNDEIANGWIDIANAILALGRSLTISKSLRDPMCLLSQAWLSGERLSKRELRILGVSANMTDDSDFAKAASSLIRMLTYTDKGCQGYASVIWMLDDCHYFAAIKQSQKNFAAIQQGLRDVFDSCPDNLCLALSFASSDVSKMKELLIEDLQSRVSHMIAAPPLSLQESFDFVVDLVSNDKFRSEQIKDDVYYPYTKESIKLAIESISKERDLTPRNLMKHLDDLTTHAEREIYPKKITPDFVKAYFKS
jgi:hypothetical protein